MIVKEKIGQVFWIHYQGETYSFSEEELIHVGLIKVSKRSSRNKSFGNLSGNSTGLVKAPMPGKIIKKLVELNDKVSVGQSLLVMEAMKMEYTLKADADGIIKNVACSVDDQVILGKVLIEIGSED